MMEEAKRRDATFASQMYVTCRLVNKETGEIKEQEVFIGELPLMTERGTFIINGAERVIVNQIVRSPGVYFKDEMDKNGRRTYNASVIPNRGAWLKFETDKNSLLHVRVQGVDVTSRAAELRLCTCDCDAAHRSITTALARCCSVRSAWSVGASYAGLVRAGPPATRAMKSSHSTRSSVPPDPDPDPPRASRR